MDISLADVETIDYFDLDKEIKTSKYFEEMQKFVEREFVHNKEVSEKLKDVVIC